MKNEDLELVRKATEINRQRFVERLAYCNGDAIARKLRATIGIPVEGFQTVPEANAWLKPDGTTTQDVARRHMEIHVATRMMLEKLKLSKKFYDAMRYFLGFNQVLHIPGNFSITVTAGSDAISYSEDGILAAGEKKFFEKFKKEIHAAMGHRRPTSFKNPEKDAEALRASHQKNVINGIDSETGEPIAMIKTDRDIAAQMNVDDESVSSAKDKAEARRIKVQRHRAKKRFH